MILSTIKRDSIRTLGWLLIFAVTSSNCRNVRRFKQEYYPGTNVLKSEGYYLNNIPVDTIKSYSKQGWLESIDVYDSRGLLNGKSRSFYPNGVPSEIVDYRQGRGNGRYISFREDGTKKLVGLLYHDKPMGDFYFMDSLTMGKGENGIDTLKTLLLLSHQPKTSMKMRVDNVGSDGHVIRTMEIDAGLPLAYYKNVVSPEVDTIKEIGVRYDSVSGRSKKFVFEHLMKDLR